MGFGSLTKTMNLPEFNNRLSSQNWKLTHYAPNSFLANTRRTQKRIGENSKFGEVQLLKYKNDAPRFVIKRILFGRPGNPSHEKRVHVFNTEVKVGSMKHISMVGPRVIAHRKTPTFGEYVMNNVRMGNKNAKIIHLGNIRRSLTPNMFNTIQKAINNFHVITRGQHGDLHGGNILLVKVPGKGKRAQIKIIDYGAFRTNKELEKKGTHVRHAGMKVYNMGPGQGFINNSSFFNSLRVKRRTL
jgi:hypothetical protein